MTRRSRVGTPGLLGRHLGSGIATSVLVAVLIAASVFAIALGPRALVQLGTAELRHELGGASPALLDLTGTGRIGLVDGLPESATLEDMVGTTDDTLTELPDGIPAPLGDHLGDTQWVVSSVGLGTTLPRTIPATLSLALGIDLRWQQRIRFVDGREPEPWEGDDGDLQGSLDRPPIEIAISERGADAADLRVGDIIQTDVAPALLVGIFVPRDPDDPYWIHQTDIGDVTISRESGQLPKIHATAYVAPLSIRGLQQAMLAGKLTAWIPVEPAGLDYADAAELQLQAREVVAAQKALPFFGQLSFRTGLVNAIDRVIQRVTTASALLALGASGLLGVLLAVYALGVRSVIERRRPALALASARGASELQLRSAMVLEGLLIAVPGSALAIAAAAALIPSDPGLVGWILPAVVALTPPVLFGVLTSGRELRATRTDLRVRSRGRARTIAELAIVGLAVVALVLLARRGIVGSSLAVGIDPLLAATPLLLSAAVCVGVLRLYPAPLLAVERLLRRRRGAAGLLGAARAIRDPALGFAAALALVVGISVVVFCTVMTTTVRAALESAAHEAVGADLRVEARSFSEELVGRIGAEEGVREAVAVTTLSGVPFRSDANTTKVVLILADTGRLHEVRPDLPVLAQKVDGRIPVLVSSDWVERLGDSGMTFESSEATRAGIIPDDAIPGATRHFLLTDAAFASELGYAPLEPDQVLIAVEPGADTAALATRLDEVVTAQQPEEFRGLVVVSDARSELAATLSSPTVASLEGVLAIGALASLLLTMLTVVLASVAAAAARNRLVGVLRILGMSARQLRSVQAWELAPVAITAAVVGTAFGALLPVIVTGVLDLRPFVGGRSQPGAVADPLWVAGAIGAFALVVLLAGAIAGALGRRFAPAGTLKMGEG